MSEVSDIALGPITELQSKLTKQQIALINRAMDLVTRSIDLQQALDPLLLEELGFELVTRPAIRIDRFGFVRRTEKIVGIKKIEDESNKNAELIELALQERALKAINGEIGNPALEAKQAEEKKQLEEALFNQLGPDFASTTIGIQQLNELEKRHTIEADQANRADINQLVTLASNQSTTNLNEDLARINAATGIANIPIGQSEALLNVSKAIGPTPIDQLEQIRSELLSEFVGPGAPAQNESSPLSDIASVVSTIPVPSAPLPVPAPFAGGVLI